MRRRRPRPAPDAQRVSTGSATALLYVLTGAGGPRRARAHRRDHLEADRGRVAGDQARSGSRSSGTSTWDPRARDLRRPRVHHRHAVTSFGALLIAAPLSIAIGLFLSELAPPAIRGPIGSLIDMLAAVPSVVIGLWGIFVLGPFIAHTIEPLLHNVARLRSRSSARRTRGRRLHGDARACDHGRPRSPRRSAASSSSSVPRDLEEARSGSARRAGRWSGASSLPYVRGGVVAAMILGLGRALGEAIAVTQVIGNGVPLSAQPLRAREHAREPDREPVLRAHDTTLEPCLARSTSG